MKKIINLKEKISREKKTEILEQNFKIKLYNNKKADMIRKFKAQRIDDYGF